MASPPPVSRAPFPAPPPFWRQFTAKNITKLQAIKKEQTEDASSKRPTWKPSELRTLELPTELQHLVPPAPPIEATYQVFGQPQPVVPSLPSLASQGVTQLFPDSSPSSPTKTPIAYLFLLTKSLLLNFNEFTSILATNPSEAEDKLEDIRTLFVNAHYLISMYRPHQARETLILMMEQQLREARKEIDDCERTNETIRSLLGELEKEGREMKENERSMTVGNQTTNLSKEDEVRELWNMIHKSDGDG